MRQVSKAGAPPLDPAKGRRPLEPFYWGGDREGVTQTSRPSESPPPDHPPIDGIKGGVAPFAGSGGSPGLAYLTPRGFA